MALTVVLSIGLDPDLLRTRNLVLHSAGYTVVSAYSVKEAAVRFQAGDFDLVLLCQSLPARERDGLTWWMRASRPGIPVVTVAGGLCTSGDVVAGLTVGSEPGALLWGIRELLINAKHRAARKASPLDKHEVDAAPMKKPPMPSAGFQVQTRGTKGRFVPLARTG
jgi:DNA-binding response OmpR family regulator